MMGGYYAQLLEGVAKKYGFSMDTQFNALSPEARKAVLYGTDEKIPYKIESKSGESTYAGSARFEGVVGNLERLYRQTDSEARRAEMEKYMRELACPSCGGKRLKPEVLAVKLNGKNIIEATELSVESAYGFFNSLRLSKTDEAIAKPVLREILSRLDFLMNVGVGYLSLSRVTGTLSGGEAQRIRLATQIGANLMGVLYVLDEPSIGLHQRDNQMLIDTLRRLRDLGNTLIVVEHDEDTIRSADHVVDMGPGAGLHGGYVVAEGTPEEIEGDANSLTGQYLAGTLKIETPGERRRSEHSISISGCSENNLKKIDVEIPLGVFTVVTGVSGSGKSTLIYDTLYPALQKVLHQSRVTPGKHRSLKFNGDVDKVIVIDQSPIGKTPRSNPATYTKVFDEIRRVFATTKEAKVRGYQPGRFSFNLKGGRCEACEGDGMIKIEMNFLPDVYVECEECKGTRYNSETLEVKYKGKSIAEVLDMTVEENLELFQNIPPIRHKLETLAAVGLEYIKLGQSSTTLSGGEAQRIKLTRELAKKGTGNTIYLLDEPTTGLHFHDVKKLIAVLNELVEKGNTVVVIEHNLDVIKSADHIIDLGPEGGDRGGYIVATGTPEEIAENPASHTGEFLQRMLGRV
ncbi:MAG: putative ABC transporter ATP-binding protein [Methanoregulaceae archaeon PtaU1.Bin222]|nr:MAG: putative ABC transporter ATP-binding protein [Methanoregulaceae archaeon PtaU1.Bin222]